MQDHNYYLVLCFFLLNSIRFIVFGISKDFNSIIFNYIQFIVFNNYLHFSSNPNVNIISDITLWSFFGLSPHPNADGSINYIYKIIYGEDNNNQTYHRMLTNETTTENTIQELTRWFDINAFLITITVLFCVVVVVSIIFFINKIYNQKNKNINNNNRTLSIRDGSLINMDRVKWKMSYNSFMIKILLIAYCNLSTITISQLTRISPNTIAVSFMSIVVLCILVIGFPIFIVITLYNNQDKLYRKEFLEKYGPLYLDFKNTPKHSKYMIIILLKQFLYAVIINISSSLNYYQNTLLLIVNCGFLISIIMYKPYVKFWTMIQAYILSSFMVLITILNFIFITDGVGKKVKIIFYISSLILHIISIFTFLGIQFMKYVEKSRQPEIHTFNIESDGINLLSDNHKDNEIVNNQHIDYILEIDYVRDESERFAEEIGKNLTNIN